jgi:hypothetical protein
MRLASFGDPALHTDEEFYFFVGQKILDGFVPYVDIWDRKPPGLFLLYAGFAAISRNVLSYQIAAWLSASLTAFTISRIVSIWTGWRGQFFAGLVYLACLQATGGFGGQSPVFYNLPMALAALLIARSLPELREGNIPRRVYGAILLCGLALTIKQVTIAESLFLGGFALATAIRGGLKQPLKYLALLGLIGAAPFAAFGLAYALAGHWPQFYQAMVLSNFAKQHYAATIIWQSAARMIVANIPVLILAIAGHRIMKPSLERQYATGWLLAAIVGVVLVPNFYWHYALPLFVPLVVLAASMLDRPLTGPLCGSALAAILTLQSASFDFALHRQARADLEKLAASAIAHNPTGTMLVYDGPVILYEMTGAKFLSPLVFPWHLTERNEAQSSGTDARNELLRILGKHPGVIVLADRLRSITQDEEGRRIVERYVHINCRLVDAKITRESRRRDMMQVWGDCRGML